MLFKTAHDGSQSSFVGSPPCFQRLAGQPSSSSSSQIIGSADVAATQTSGIPTTSRSQPRQNGVVTLYRCLECDQIEEFQQLVIEHAQLLAKHKRLQSAPFSASEHTEHRRQITAHAARVAAFRSRVFGAGPLTRS